MVVPALGATNDCPVRHNWTGGTFKINFFAFWINGPQKFSHVCRDNSLSCNLSLFYSSSHTNPVFTVSEYVGALILSLWQCYNEFLLSMTPSPALAFHSLSCNICRICQHSNCGWIHCAHPFQRVANNSQILTRIHEWGYYPMCAAQPFQQ